MTEAASEDRLFALDNPPWVVANEVWLRGDRYISVYRSAWLKDTDALYAPVAGVLRGAELVAKDFNYDEDMMFGRAEWQLWRL